MAAHCGREDDRQPADDGGALPAERLRGSHRMVRPQLLAPRGEHSVRAPPQRPGHRRCHRGAGADGRRGPSRGDVVRQRRTDGKRRRRHPRAQSADPGRRSEARPLAGRRDEAHRRGVQRATGAPEASLGGRARLHGVLRLAPGRDQEGHVRPATIRVGGLGRPLSADRPERPRPELRGDHQDQLAVRQGRRRLSAPERVPPRSSPRPAGRVLAGRAGDHRRRGRRAFGGATLRPLRDELSLGHGAVRAPLLPARGERLRRPAQGRVARRRQGGRGRGRR